MRKQKKDENGKAIARSMFYMGVNNCKFRNPVRPGDKLVLKLDLIKQRKNIFVCEAKSIVNGKVCCEAELTCMINAGEA